MTIISSFTSSHKLKVGCMSNDFVRVRSSGSFEPLNFKKGTIKSLDSLVNIHFNAFFFGGGGVVKRYV